MALCSMHSATGALYECVAVSSHEVAKRGAYWSRHFSQLERDMDVLLGDLFGLSHNLIAEWIRSHRYVTGKQMLDAGLSELIGLVPLMDLLSPESKPSDRDRKATKSSRRVSSAHTKRSQGLRRHAGE